jgi:hypothetical protein
VNSTVMSIVSAMALIRTDDRVIGELCPRSKSQVMTDVEVFALLPVSRMNSPKHLNRDLENHE